MSNDMSEPQPSITCLTYLHTKPPAKAGGDDDNFEPIEGIGTVHMKGSCHCGKVFFEATSLHPWPYMRCYCGICRKTTGGGGFQINLKADWPPTRLVGEDSLSFYHPVKRDDSGVVTGRHNGERAFCRECGSQLWNWDSRWPGMFHPTAGCIDTELPKPPLLCHIMTDFKQGWSPLQKQSDDDKVFPTYPDMSIASFHKAHAAEATRIAEPFHKARAPEVAPSIAQLTYWDGHGNAEIVRLMMAVCGQVWEDKVALDDTGATHLSSVEQLKKLMSSGMLMTDQIPLLQIDGLNLVQKHACVRYLARKFGLYGDDNATATQIDIWAETILDYGGYNFEKWHPRIERAFEGHFLVGNKLSFADMMLFKVHDDMNEKNRSRLPPKLKAHYEKMLALPRLDSYLKSDKRFPRPGREGYFDRVKATIPWMPFAGGDGKTPAIRCDKWNFGASPNRQDVVSKQPVVSEAVSGTYTVFYHTACTKFYGRALPIVLTFELAKASYNIKLPEDAPDGTGFVSAPAIQSPSGACVAQLPFILMLLSEELGLVPGAAPQKAKHHQLLMDAADLLMEIFAKKEQERYDKWFTYLEHTLTANGTSFFVGGSATPADFSMFFTFLWIEKKSIPFDKFPNLAKWYLAVKDNETIKQLGTTGVPFMP